MVSAEKLKHPDNISRIFNVAGFLERFKRNFLRIVLSVERADDDKGRVSKALKVFELANDFINSLFRREVGRFNWNDLKIIKDKNRGFILAKRKKKKNKVVDVVFLKFKNVKVKVGRFKVGKNIVKSGGVVAASDTGRS